MECDICRRDHDRKRLPFLCPVDARNQAYDGRFKHLQVLIESDGIRKEISELGTSADPGSSSAQDEARAQQQTAEDRTTQILEAADKLRDDIKAARDEIHARKAALTRRKADLATVSEGLQERRTKKQSELHKSAQMLQYRWSQSAEEMASTRAFLCTEAASLYGLKRVVKKGTRSKPEYQIARVPILDLTSMNSLSPEFITTSLGHVSHVLMLASYYLAIRLPAEIIRPHRDYPYPTIMNLQNSYRHPAIPFPDTSGTTTPLSSAPDLGIRHGQRSPRPRPLYVHKPLPQLLRDDSVAYAHFLEGVALLAYNIAWLCSSQGILIGDKSSFEDICQMGRNLYNLLIQPPIPRPTTSLSSPDTTKTPVNSTQNASAPNLNWIGRYSHGTMYYHLGGADGTELVKAFKLPSPTKLVDKLQKKLVGDAPADWEVLEDDAWKVEDVPT